VCALFLRLISLIAAELPRTKGSWRENHKRNHLFSYRSFLCNHLSLASTPDSRPVTCFECAAFAITHHLLGPLFLFPAPFQEFDVSQSHPKRKVLSDRHLFNHTKPLILEFPGQSGNRGPFPHSGVLSILFWSSYGKQLSNDRRPHPSQCSKMKYVFESGFKRD